MTISNGGQKTKLIKLIILGICVAVSVKVLFVGFSADEEYHLVLCYRLAHGDTLLSEVWDTLQTSAFYGQLLIWIYMKLFHTVTGSLIFLRLCGILTQAAVAGFLHSTLKKHIEARKALVISAAFFCTYTKLLAMPEFSNLQTWAIVLMVCCLWRAKDAYDESQAGRVTRLIVAAALALCVAVLSSACVILVPIVIVMQAILFKGSGVKKNFLFFGTCAAVAFVYLGTIIAINGFGRTMAGISGILAGDDTHLGENLLTGYSKVASYLKDLGAVALWVVGTGALAFAVYMIIRAVTGKNSSLWMYIWIAEAFAVTLFNWLVRKTGYEGLKLYIPVILAIGITEFVRKSREDGARDVIVPFFGMILGIGLFVNVLLFSNVDLITNLTFINTSVLWGLVIIAIRLEQKKIDGNVQTILATFFLVMAVGTALTLNSGPYGTTVFNIPDLNYMRKGPAKGAFVSRTIEAVYDTNTELFMNTVREGSNVLIVTNFIHNQSLSTLYMLNNVNISHYTVNSTPTYGDKLYEYWGAHPDKWPDAVIINSGSCAYEDYLWALDFLGNQEGWEEYSLYDVQYYIKK
ncbi:MAG: hypothetical protein J5487_08185 [Lachnospiraceae bacterium]|nr:hypothetical protein [Lachnospiraceae bacterium]